MSRRTEFVTAFCTLGCALGIGFVMQSGEVAELRYGSGQLAATATTPLVGEPAVPVEVKDLTLAKNEGLLDVSQITLTSAKSGLTSTIRGKTDQVVRAAARGTLATEPQEYDYRVNPDCEMTATVTPDAAAMVTLSLDAPCHADERVTIKHAQLIFAEKLSPEGTLEVLMPALSEETEVRVSFLNGETVSASTTVDSVKLYDRVILQWRGATGAQIHAREFGADYGTDGHVWSGAARDVSAVAGGRGGFLTTLGNNDVYSPMMAEVYTFPSIASDAQGDIALTVETEVTEENCGSSIQARTHEFSGGKEVASQHLTLAIPNCGSVGNFLVLNNLLQDLTVARK